MSAEPIYPTDEDLSHAKMLVNDCQESTRLIRDILGRALKGQRSVAPHFQSAEAWAKLANAAICDHLNRWNLDIESTLEEAKHAVKEAIAADPNLAEAHFVDGFVKRACGDHEAALEAFNRALKRDPEFARAYAQKANELINVGKPQQAPALVKKAIALNPKSKSLGMCFWILGKSYFFAGHYSEAIDWLKISMGLRDDLFYIHTHLVAALAITGQIKEAKQALETLNSKFKPYTLKRVDEDEKANPNNHPIIVAGRLALHQGLLVAGMPEDGELPKKAEHLSV